MRASPSGIIFPPKKITLYKLCKPFYKNKSLQQSRKKRRTIFFFFFSQSSPHQHPWEREREILLFFPSAEAPGQTFKSGSGSWRKRWAIVRQQWQSISRQCARDGIQSRRSNRFDYISGAVAAPAAPAAAERVSTTLTSRHVHTYIYIYTYTRCAGLSVERPFGYITAPAPTTTLRP